MELAGDVALDLDLSRVWQGGLRLTGPKILIMDFCSVGRGGDRLSRRWRRVPRAGVLRSWSLGLSGPGQIGIGRVLMVCQLAVRSGVQGQSAGRCTRVSQFSGAVAGPWV